MSKQKLWRCQNPECSTDPHGRLICDFWSEHPVCPKCQSDARRPEDRGVIIPLAIVHFEPPGKRRGKGIGHVACDPKKSARGLHASGHPSAVNCPDCQRTQAWLDSAEEHELQVSPDQDYEVGVVQGVVQRRDDRPPLSPCD